MELGTKKFYGSPTVWSTQVRSKDIVLFEGVNGDNNKIIQEDTREKWIIMVINNEIIQEDTRENG